MTSSVHSLLLTNVGSGVGDLVMVTVGVLLGRKVDTGVGIRLGLCFIKREEQCKNEIISTQVTNRINSFIHISI